MSFATITPPGRGQLLSDLPWAAYPSQYRLDGEAGAWPRIGGLTAEYGHQITVPMPGYTFTITAGAATAGAIYSNNSETFEVALTIAGATTLHAFGSGAPEANGTLTKVSGTGDATLTFSAVENLQESTHPSVVYFPDGWNGKRYWGAFCYYPAGENTLEMVCVLCSDDGETWAVPTGGSNPVFNSGVAIGYSDNILVADTDGSLNLIYRWNSTTEQWFLSKSFDGAVWTSPTRIINTTLNTVLSLSVVRFADAWHAWAVDASGLEATYVVNHWVSSGGLTGPWALSAATNVAHDLGIHPWHIDVAAFGGSLFMYANCKASAQIAGNYLLRSADGVTWTLPATPAHLNSTTAFEAGGLYRGCIVPMNVVGEPYLDVFYGCMTAGAAAWYEARTRIYLNPLSKSLDGQVQTGLYKAVPSTGTTNTADTARRVRVAPMMVDRRVHITEVAINVTTGQAGGTAVVGVFADMDGKPGALIYTSTALDCSATAVVTQVADFWLDPGKYWVGGMPLGATPATITFVSGLARSGDATPANMFANVGGGYFNTLGADTLWTRWITTWAQSNTAMMVLLKVAAVE